MGLINIHTLFWFCALAGSGMFLVQFGLSFLGGDVDDSGDSSQADAGKAKWFSRQAVTGFLMMFGWAALTCENQFGLGLALTLGIALASGGLAVVIVAFIFKWAKRLHSTGTVFRLADAVGKQAVIYHRIPKDGVGKITISLHHLTHELEAVSFNGEEIPSFVPVQVIKLSDEGRVVVVPVTK